MAHNHRDRITKADVCGVLCQKFNSICFRKASKHCFYEDYVLLRNQLLLLEYEEDDPAILTKLNNAADKVRRFIEEVAEPTKHTIDFVKDIHKKLLFLCDMLSKGTDIVREKDAPEVPLPDKLNALFVRYIELEYEVMQNSNNEGTEYQIEAEQRVLYLLLRILKELKGKKNKVQNKDEKKEKEDVKHPYATSMNVLKIVTNVKIEYRSSEGFIENIMTKLLKTLNLLEKVDQVKSTSKSLRMSELLQSPEASQIQKYLKNQTCVADEKDALNKPTTSRAAEATQEIATISSATSSATTPSATTSSTTASSATTSSAATLLATTSSASTSTANTTIAITSRTITSILQLEDVIDDDDIIEEKIEAMSLASSETQRKILTIDLDDEDDDCYMVYFKPEVVKIRDILDSGSSSSSSCSNISTPFGCFKNGQTSKRTESNNRCKVETNDSRFSSVTTSSNCDSNNKILSLPSCSTMTESENNSVFVSNDNDSDSGACHEDNSLQAATSEYINNNSNNDRRQTILPTDPEILNQRKLRRARLKLALNFEDTPSDEEITDEEVILHKKYDEESDLFKELLDNEKAENNNEGFTKISFFNESAISDSNNIISDDNVSSGDINDFNFDRLSVSTVGSEASKIYQDYCNYENNLSSDKNNDSEIILLSAPSSPRSNLNDIFLSDDSNSSVIITEIEENRGGDDLVIDLVDDDDVQIVSSTPSQDINEILESCELIAPRSENNDAMEECNDPSLLIEEEETNEAEDPVIERIFQCIKNGTTDINDKIIKVENTTSSQNVKITMQNHAATEMVSEQEDSNTVKETKDRNKDVSIKIIESNLDTLETEAFVNVNDTTEASVEETKAQLDRLERESINMTEQPSNNDVIIGDSISTREADAINESTIDYEMLQLESTIEVSLREETYNKLNLTKNVQELSANSSSSIVVTEESTRKDSVNDNSDAVINDIQIELAETANSENIQKADNKIDDTNVQIETCIPVGTVETTSSESSTIVVEASAPIDSIEMINTKSTSIGAENRTISDQVEACRPVDLVETTNNDSVITIHQVETCFLVDDPAESTAIADSPIANDQVETCLPADPPECINNEGTTKSDCATTIEPVDDSAESTAIPDSPIANDQVETCLPDDPPEHTNNESTTIADSAITIEPVDDRAERKSNESIAIIDSPIANDQVETCLPVDPLESTNNESTTIADSAITIEPVDDPAERKSNESIAIADSPIANDQVETCLPVDPLENINYESTVIADSAITIKPVETCFPVDDPAESTAIPDSPIANDQVETCLPDDPPECTNNESTTIADSAITIEPVGGRAERKSIESIAIIDSPIANDQVETCLPVDPPESTNNESTTIADSPIANDQVETCFPVDFLESTCNESTAIADSVTATDQVETCASVDPLESTTIADSLIPNDDEVEICLPIADSVTEKDQVETYASVDFAQTTNNEKTIIADSTIKNDQAEVCASIDLPKTTNDEDSTIADSAVTNNHLNSAESTDSENITKVDSTVINSQVETDIPVILEEISNSEKSIITDNAIEVPTSIDTSETTNDDCTAADSTITNNQVETCIAADSAEMTNSKTTVIADSIITNDQVETFTPVNPIEASTTIADSTIANAQLETCILVDPAENLNSESIVKTDITIINDQDKTCPGIDLVKTSSVSTTVTDNTIAIDQTENSSSIGPTDTVNESIKIKHSTITNDQVKTSPPTEELSIEETNYNASTKIVENVNNTLLENVQVSTNFKTCLISNEMHNTTEEPEDGNNEQAKECFVENITNNEVVNIGQSNETVDSCNLISNDVVETFHFEEIKVDYPANEDTDSISTGISMLNNASPQVEDNSDNSPINSDSGICSTEEVDKLNLDDINSEGHNDAEICQTEDIEHPNSPEHSENLIIEDSTVTNEIKILHMEVNNTLLDDSTAVTNEVEVCSTDVITNTVDDTPVETSANNQITSYNETETIMADAKRIDVKRNTSNDSQNEFTESTVLHDINEIDVHLEEVVITTAEGSTSTVSEKGDTSAVPINLHPEDYIREEVIEEANVPAYVMYETLNKNDASEIVGEGDPSKINYENQSSCEEFTAFTDHNCSNSLDVLAFVAAEQKKMENAIEVKQKGSKRNLKVRSPKSRKVKGRKAKNKVPALPRRVTRSSAQLNIISETQNCKPSSFLNLENLDTPPPNRVYNLIPESITENEESLDSCDNQQTTIDSEIISKNLIFEEDTIDDGIFLVQHKKEQSSSSRKEKEVVISIPENEKEYPGINYEILKQAEEFEKISVPKGTETSYSSYNLNTEAFKANMWHEIDSDQLTKTVVPEFHAEEIIECYSTNNIETFCDDSNKNLGSNIEIPTPVTLPTCKNVEKSCEISNDSDLVPFSTIEDKATNFSPAKEENKTLVMPVKKRRNYSKKNYIIDKYEKKNKMEESLVNNIKYQENSSDLNDSFNKLDFEISSRAATVIEETVSDDLGKLQDDAKTETNEKVELNNRTKDEEVGEIKEKPNKQNAKSTNDEIKVCSKKSKAPKDEKMEDTKTSSKKLQDDEKTETNEKVELNNRTKDEEVGEIKETPNKRNAKSTNDEIKVCSKKSKAPKDEKMEDTRTSSKKLQDDAKTETNENVELNNRTNDEEVGEIKETPNKRNAKSTNDEIKVCSKKTKAPKDEKMEDTKTSSTKRSNTKTTKEEKIEEINKKTNQRSHKDEKVEEIKETAKKASAKLTEEDKSEDMKDTHKKPSTRSTKVEKVEDVKEMPKKSDPELTEDGAIEEIKHISISVKKSSKRQMRTKAALKEFQIPYVQLEKLPLDFDYKKFCESLKKSPPNLRSRSQEDISKKAKRDFRSLSESHSKKKQENAKIVDAVNESKNDAEKQGKCCDRSKSKSEDNNKTKQKTGKVEDKIKVVPPSDKYSKRKRSVNDNKSLVSEDTNKEALNEENLESEERISRKSKKCKYSRRSSKPDVLSSMEENVTQNKKSKLEKDKENVDNVKKTTTIEQSKKKPKQSEPQESEIKKKTEISECDVITNNLENVKEKCHQKRKSRKRRISETDDKESLITDHYVKVSRRKTVEDLASETTKFDLQPLKDNLEDFSDEKLIQEIDTSNNYENLEEIGPTKKDKIVKENEQTVADLNNVVTEHTEATSELETNDLIDKKDDSEKTLEPKSIEENSLKISQSQINIDEDLAMSPTTMDTPDSKKITEVCHETEFNKDVEEIAEVNERNEEKKQSNEIDEDHNSSNEIIPHEEQVVEDASLTFQNNTIIQNESQTEQTDNMEEIKTDTQNTDNKNESIEDQILENTISEDSCIQTETELENSITPVVECPKETPLDKVEIEIQTSKDEINSNLLKTNDCKTTTLPTTDIVELEENLIIPENVESDTDEDSPEFEEHVLSDTQDEYTIDEEFEEIQNNLESNEKESEAGIELNPKTLDSSTITTTPNHDDASKNKTKDVQDLEIISSSIEKVEEVGNSLEIPETIIEHMKVTESPDTAIESENSEKANLQIIGSCDNVDENKQVDLTESVKEICENLESSEKTNKAIDETSISISSKSVNVPTKKFLIKDLLNNARKKSRKKKLKCINVKILVDNKINAAANEDCDESNKNLFPLKDKTTQLDKFDSGIFDCDNLSASQKELKDTTELEKLNADKQRTSVVESRNLKEDSKQEKKVDTKLCNDVSSKEIEQLSEIEITRNDLINEEDLSTEKNSNAIENENALSKTTKRIHFDKTVTNDVIEDSTENTKLTKKIKRTGIESKIKMTLVSGGKKIDSIVSDNTEEKSTNHKVSDIKTVYGKKDSKSIANIIDALKNRISKTKQNNKEEHLIGKSEETPLPQPTEVSEESIILEQDQGCDLSKVMESKDQHVNKECSINKDIEISGTKDKSKNKPIMENYEIIITNNNLTVEKVRETKDISEKSLFLNIEQTKNDNIKSIQNSDETFKPSTSTVLNYVLDVPTIINGEGFKCPRSPETYKPHKYDILKSSSYTGTNHRKRRRNTVDVLSDDRPITTIPPKKSNYFRNKSIDLAVFKNVPEINQTTSSSELPSAKGSLEISQNEEKEITESSKPLIKQNKREDVNHLKSSTSKRNLEINHQALLSPTDQKQIRDSVITLLDSSPTKGNLLSPTHKRVSKSLVTDTAKIDKDPPSPITLLDSSPTKHNLLSPTHQIVHKSSITDTINIDTGLLSPSTLLDSTPTKGGLLSPTHRSMHKSSIIDTTKIDEDPPSPVTLLDSSPAKDNLSPTHQRVRKSSVTDTTDKIDEGLPSPSTLLDSTPTKGDLLSPTHQNMHKSSIIDTTNIDEDPPSPVTLLDSSPAKDNLSPTHQRVRKSSVTDTTDKIDEGLPSLITLLDSSPTKGDLLSPTHKRVSKSSVTKMDEGPPSPITLLDSSPTKGDLSPTHQRVHKRLVTNTTKIDKDPPSPNTFLDSSPTKGNVSPTHQRVHKSSIIDTTKIVEGFPLPITLSDSSPTKGNLSPTHQRVCKSLIIDTTKIDESPPSPITLLESSPTKVNLLSPTHKRVRKSLIIDTSKIDLRPPSSITLLDSSPTKGNLSPTHKRVRKISVTDTSKIDKGPPSPITLLDSSLTKGNLSPKHQRVRKSSIIDTSKVDEGPSSPIILLDSSLTKSNLSPKHQRARKSSIIDTSKIDEGPPSPSTLLDSSPIKGNLSPKHQRVRKSSIIDTSKIDLRPPSPITLLDSSSTKGNLSPTHKRVRKISITDASKIDEAPTSPITLLDSSPTRGNLPPTDQRVRKSSVTNTTKIDKVPPSPITLSDSSPAKVLLSPTHKRVHKSSITDTSKIDESSPSPIALLDSSPTKGNLSPTHQTACKSLVTDTIEIVEHPLSPTNRKHRKTDTNSKNYEKPVGTPIPISRKRSCHQISKLEDLDKTDISFVSSPIKENDEMSLQKRACLELINSEDICTGTFQSESCVNLFNINSDDILTSVMDSKKTSLLPDDTDVHDFSISHEIEVPLDDNDPMFDDIDKSEGVSISPKNDFNENTFVYGVGDSFVDNNTVQPVEEVVIELSTSTSVASTSCGTADNLIESIYPNVPLDNTIVHSGRLQPNMKYLFDSEKDENHFDPLLGGKCDSSESDTSTTNNKEIPTPELENVVLVDDNILPYIPTLTENNLNQDPSSSLNDSTVDNSTDFQLLEHYLSTNNLARESSPPLPQSCDPPYQTNLKEEILEFHEKRPHHRDIEYVDLTQYQQQNITIESMNELMNVVLSRIQNLNDMTRSSQSDQRLKDSIDKQSLYLLSKAHVPTSTPTDYGDSMGSVSEFSILTNTTDEVDSVHEISPEDLQSNLSPSHETSNTYIIPEASTIEITNIPCIGDAVSDFTNFYYVPVSQDNNPLNISSTKKVIVERIPQYPEEQPEAKSDVETNNETSTSTSSNTAVSPRANPKIILSPINVIKRTEMPTRSANRASLISNISNNLTSGTNKTKNNSSTAHTSNTANVGFVRTSSRTRVSAPRPKKVTDNTNKGDESSSGTDTDSGLSSNNKNKSAENHMLKLKVRNDFDASVNKPSTTTSAANSKPNSTIVLPKELSLYIIEDGNNPSNKSATGSSLKEVSVARKEEPTKLTTKRSPAPHRSSSSVTSSHQKSPVQQKPSLPQASPVQQKPSLPQASSVQQKPSSPQASPAHQQPLVSKISAVNQQLQKSPVPKQTTTSQKSPLHQQRIASPKSPASQEISSPQTSSASSEKSQKTEKSPIAEKSPVQPKLLPPPKSPVPDKDTERKPSPCKSPAPSSSQLDEQPEVLTRPPKAVKSPVVTEPTNKDHAEPSCSHSESDMIDNVKRRKRKPVEYGERVDYSSIEKLLGHEAQNLKASSKGKQKRADANGEDLSKWKGKRKQEPNDDKQGKSKSKNCGGATANSNGGASTSSGGGASTSSSDGASTSTSGGGASSSRIPPGEGTSTSADNESSNNRESAVFEDSDDDIPMKRSKQDPKLHPDSMNDLFDRLVKEGNVNNVKHRSGNRNAIAESTKQIVTRLLRQDNVPIDAEPPRTVSNSSANATARMIANNTIFNLDLPHKRPNSIAQVKQVGVVNPIPRPPIPVRREREREPLPPPPPSNRNNSQQLRNSEEGRSSSQYYNAYYPERSRRSYQYSSTRDSNRSSHQSSSSRRTEYPSHSSDQRYTSQRSSGSSRSRTSSSRHHSSSRSSTEQRNYNRYPSTNDLSWREDMKKKFPHMFKDEVYF